MTTSHQFGGRWTDEKLDKLRKYLNAYRKIFTRNPRAAKLRTNFVDAFAGTGYRHLLKENQALNLPLFIDDTPIYDDDVTSFQKGSARIALETSPPFDHYLFIEQNPAYIVELEELRKQFPAIAHRIERPG